MFVYSILLLLNPSEIPVRIHDSAGDRNFEHLQLSRPFQHNGGDVSAVSPQRTVGTLPASPLGHELPLSTPSTVIGTFRETQSVFRALAVFFYVLHKSGFQTDSRYDV